MTVKKAINKASNHHGIVGRSAVRLTTADLFKDAQELVIEHQGELYRLRITKNGKLILTK